MRRCFFFFTLDRINILCYVMFIQISAQKKFITSIKVCLRTLFYLFFLIFYSCLRTLFYFFIYFFEGIFYSCRNEVVSNTTVIRDVPFFYFQNTITHFENKILFHFRIWNKFMKYCNCICIWKCILISCLFEM